MSEKKAHKRTAIEERMYRRLAAGVARPVKYTVHIYIYPGEMGDVRLVRWAAAHEPFRPPWRIERGWMRNEGPRGVGSRAQPAI